MFAGVEPIATDYTTDAAHDVMRIDSENTYVQRYDPVSAENYNAYCTYLVENGYELVAYDDKCVIYDNLFVVSTFKNNSESFFEEDHVTMRVIYIPNSCYLWEVYPLDVKIETLNGVSVNTVCPHCIAGYNDCSSCGTFGMCRYCDGMGYRTRYTSDGYEYPTCNYCDGTGACSRCGYEGFIKCNYCNGSGYLN